MITSRDNPKLKLVRKLETRRQRDKLGQFVAEGEDLVAAALEGGWELDFALVDAARPPELSLRAEQVSSHLLAEVSTLGHAPRVVGVFRAARPQRKLPYRDLDVDLGVQQMQLYGVRYYMAFTNRAVTQARANAALREVGQVGGNPQLLAQLKASSSPDAAAIDRASPWVIFELADSDLVTPLRYEPVVTGIAPSQCRQA